MQAPAPFLIPLDLFAERPTVGALMALCEENYRLLHRLAPELPGLGGGLLSRASGHADLLLEVHEQARYTTTLRLTHHFPASSHGEQIEPDAWLRAYHDAGQVEVLTLRQTVLPLFTHYQAPALFAKWRANLFLSRWLGYCVHAGHRFPPGAPRAQPTAAAALSLVR